MSKKIDVATGIIVAVVLILSKYYNCDYLDNCPLCKRVKYEMH